MHVLRLLFFALLLVTFSLPQFALADEPWPGVIFTCLPSVNSLFARVQVVDEQLKERSNNMCRYMDGKNACSTAWTKDDLDLAKKDNAFFDENFKGAHLECAIEDKKGNQHNITLKTEVFSNGYKSEIKTVLLFDEVKVYDEFLYTDAKPEEQDIYETQRTIDYIQGELRICTLTTDAAAPPQEKKTLTGQCVYRQL